MKILFKTLKIIITIIVSLVLVVTILNIIPFTFSKVKGTNEFRNTGKYPLVIPHGGAKDLVPENTIYSYDMLISEYNVDVLEIDLSLTKDNILISHHDLDLEMSDESELNDKFIKDYTYDEIINAYKEDDYYLARTFVDINGNKPFELETDSSIMDRMVPAKLEDIFNEVGSSKLYVLEIKDSPTSRGYEEGSLRYEVAAQALIDLITEYKLEEVVVNSSFSDEVINYFKENASNLKVSAGTKEGTEFAVYSALFVDFFWSVKSEVLVLPNPQSMKIPKSLISIIEKMPKFIQNRIAVKIDNTWRANLTTKMIIKKAHRKNMAVIYWTVNDEEEMRHLINIGADGIITDRPDLLIKIINELKNK